MGACPVADREQDNLLMAATDRFERRLSEECASLRVEMVDRDSAIRQEMANLRVEMSAGDAATRLEIGKLRVDMSEQFASSRIHSEAQHRELLKWAIVFWVSQAAAVAGLVSALA